MNAISVSGVISRACSNLIAALVMTSLVCSGAMAARASIKVIDPLPVMVLKGYSEALPFKAPSALFIDKKRGDIWVADSGNHQIVGFDSKGNPLLAFRHMSIDPTDGAAMPGSPTSLAVDSTGQAFVTDPVSHRVAMYDYRGRLIKRIDIAKVLGVDLAKPMCLDIDEQDNLYILDRDLRLTVLDRYQEFVRTISMKPEPSEKQNPKGSDDEDGSVSSISAMEIRPDGRIILVNSSDSPCVRVLNGKGELLIAFGDIDLTDLRIPVDAAGIEDGTVWIVDRGMHVVRQYSAEGKFQQYIGGGPGRRPGEMILPVAASTDGKERLYIVERGGNRVQVFSLTK